MPREDLQAASDALRRAASAVDDEAVEERLYEQSRQMADLATRDRGPDHGRLARHMSALDELAAATDGDAREAVEAALEHVTAYRETVEGV